MQYLQRASVPVAARSKALVCGRSPAEIVGSNTTGGMDVCCECCVLSGRVVCDELITRPGESYLLWCVVCGLENTSPVNEEEGQGPLGGYRVKSKKITACCIYSLIKNHIIAHHST